MVFLVPAKISPFITKEPLKNLKRICDKDLNSVNKVLLEQVYGTLPFITQVANHLIASGGKRLRPLLTLATATLCGYKGKDHIPLAACVEMIHTATLLHDDVVDSSDKRRNQPSANLLWGNSAPVLVGDFLFSKAFVLMVEYGSKEVLRTLSIASSTIVEGEVFQLCQLTEPTSSIKTYLKIIKSKTACLFAAACKVGSLVANASEKTIKGLENYGYNLGLAFQIIDDLLDYIACEKTLGKTLGDDFRQGKITLPSIIAFENASLEEKKFWDRTLMKKNQLPGDFEKAILIIKRHGAERKTLDLAKYYVDNAKKSLDIIPPSKFKNCLNNIASYCINRSF